MEAIRGNEFPKFVIPLIDSAKESIKIVVFDWRWYPDDPANPVQLFNQAIIRAVRRGVKVGVVSNDDHVLAILKKEGCEVKKPMTKNLVHAKLMIFDDKNIVIGSHNFTQNAFTMNHEISVYIPDCEKVAEFLRFFNTLFV
jgi:phosphatidylserine/phosphatidylglycerophosphate/cardiolipin synthase-like enzyme